MPFSPEIKTNDELECLFKQRKEKAKGPLNRIWRAICVNSDGTPYDHTDKKILCEYTKIALSIPEAWVECGEVLDMTKALINLKEFPTSLAREVFIVIPEFSENASDLWFITSMNIDGRPILPKRSKSMPDSGNFCTYPGGC